MKVAANEVDPKLLVDQDGYTRITVPKGTVVFFNASPAMLMHDTEFKCHVKNLYAWPFL